MIEVRQRRLFLPEMEGVIARWYANVRGSESQLRTYREQARQLTAGLAPGADVLEVAPGPGYMAIEVARLGLYRVSGLDISRSFVEIATRGADEAGVEVDFRRGDVASMPFAAASFDLIYCQAAFKNFRRPVDALNEMHRVLRPGGTTIIQDMCHEATGDDIDREVAGMRLSLVNSAMTRVTLRVLRRRAYGRGDFARAAAQSAFGATDIQVDGISIEVRLRKPPTG
jgi:ubiquinone/menaquinone biosynthesis C-methylase UbiE